MTETRPVDQPGPFFPMVWRPLAVLAFGAVLHAACWFVTIPAWLLYLSVAAAIVVMGYFLVQTTGRFFGRRRQGRWGALFRLMGCTILLLPFVFTVFGGIFLALLGPSEDGFADHLVIPPELAIEEPGAVFRASEDGPPDAFQQTVREALTKSGEGVPEVAPTLPSLRLLARENPVLLRQYLCSSAAWRVFEERGNLYATRRWKENGDWRSSLNGYYSDFGRPRSGTQPFQTRTTIALSGKPLYPANAKVTAMNEGSASQTVKLERGNQLDESVVLIDCGGVLAELFEQSNGPARRITQAVLPFLENEFAGWRQRAAFDATLLPEGSTKQGAPSFTLRNGFQPGIYEFEAWINPGAPGLVYLKAYEVTKNTPLSTSRLRDSSNSRCGWSSTPEDLFFTSSQITIYEGDWGKPYAARFEIWFVPDDRSPERKLVEKNYKIEGWQR